MSLPNRYTKAEHDKNHETLGQFIDCGWCALELEAMEEANFI